jgi:hypothetical protein
MLSTSDKAPATAWDDKGSRDALVSALVNDAATIIEALREAKLDEPAAQAVGLLALVAGQDVEPAEGPMAPTAGGESPAGSPRTGSSAWWIRRPGT